MRKLQESAIRIRISPDPQNGQVVPVKLVIKVLADLSKSYRKFLEIEFLRIKDFQKVYAKNPRALDSLLSELQLNIVDLQFNNFEAALSPDLLDSSQSLFSDDVNEWKNGIYEQYRTDILYADYTNTKYMNSISKQYTAEERKLIYQPLFNAAGDGTNYKLQLTNQDHKVERVILKPEIRIAKFYTAKAPQPSMPVETKTVHFYAKVRTAIDGTQFKKTGIREVLYVEEMEHDTYPYKPHQLTHDHMTYVLKESINCEVMYKADIYTISYKPLDISVMNESRELAEDMFSEKFAMLFIESIESEGKKLSAKKERIRATILDLIAETKEE